MKTTGMRRLEEGRGDSERNRERLGIIKFFKKYSGAQRQNSKKKKNKKIKEQRDRQRRREEASRECK